ncbi:MAG: PAS and helix-turn-helix domain-containing protein [Chloroflexi bacterium]|nr:PAS and helix-turn-helix domain-containing protein [Chloroflexota bacterium]
MDTFKPPECTASETPWSDLISHDGMFSVDEQQRIIHWSPRAESILGLKAEDVLGKPCHEVVGGRDTRNFRFCRRNCPVLLNALKGRTTPDYDILCTVPEGEGKWLNISVAIPAGDRWPFQVVHLFRDVTQRRRSEEFARKASATLREYLEEGTETEEQADGKGRLSAPPIPKLSRREMEVLRLLAVAKTTVEIAKILGVQPVTARNHITRLLTRLGVESRLQAVVYASQNGLI